jgi:hypothetical protein
VIDEGLQNGDLVKIKGRDRNCLISCPAEFHFKFHDIPQLKQPIAAKLS